MARRLGSRQLDALLNRIYGQECRGQISVLHLSKVYNAGHAAYHFVGATTPDEREAEVRKAMRAAFRDVAREGAGTMSSKARQRVERMIARRVVLDAIRMGYMLNIDNGGDTEELSAPTTSAKAVLAAMFQTDDEYLTFYRADSPSVRSGWVRFVCGNDGWDVVNDYTTNLDDVMKGADALAEAYQ